MLDYGTDYEFAEVVVAAAAADRDDAVVVAGLSHEIYSGCCSNSVEIGDGWFELSMDLYWTMADLVNITRSEVVADAHTGWERLTLANH